MKTINELSFKTKLVALCVLLAMVSVVIAVISYRGVNTVEDVAEKITDQVMPKLQNANEMFAEYRRVRITLRTLGLSGLTKEQQAEAVSGALDAIAAYEEAEERYLSHGFIPGQKEVYDEVSASWDRFKAVGTKVLELQKKGTPADHEAMVKIFLSECPEAAKVYTVQIKKLLAFHKSVADRRTVELKEAGDRTNLIILIVGLVGVAFGLSMGWLFSSSISKSIQHVTDGISSSVDQVASASQQIAASSARLAQSSTEQAASLAETASSLEEISAMISKASDSSQETATTSTASQKKAEEGRAAVGQMLESMEDISKSNDEIMAQINESNRQMSEIVIVIHEIAEKTKVINEIVFQTKLLSFNASVEAARAGEHGKGFAVVAEEVGNLASMSGNAAKEISDMLTASTSKVESIVIDTKAKVETLVAAGRQKVEGGVDVARKCADVLDEIVQNVSRVTSLAEEISKASKEQALGVAEINKAMGLLDQVTQENTAASEEAAASADQLSLEGRNLRGAVAELEKTVQGANANASRSASSIHAVSRHEDSASERRSAA